APSSWRWRSPNRSSWVSTTARAYLGGMTAEPDRRMPRSAGRKHPCADAQLTGLRAGGVCGLRLPLSGPDQSGQRAPGTPGARAAEVDVDELAVRVDADAERARVGDADVESLGEVVELADRDVLDLDVHRRGVEVAAGVALVEPEAGDQVDAVVGVVIADPRQVLVELGAHGADVAGLGVAPHVIELGER